MWTILGVLLIAMVIVGAIVFACISSKDEVGQTIEQLIEQNRNLDGSLDQNFVKVMCQQNNFQMCFECQDFLCHDNQHPDNPKG